MARLTIQKTNEAFDDKLGQLYEQRGMKKAQINALNVNIAIIDGRIQELEQMRKDLLSDADDDETE